MSRSVPKMPAATFAIVCVFLAGFAAGDINANSYVNWWDVSLANGTLVVDTQNVHNGTLVGAVIAPGSTFTDEIPAIKSNSDAQYARFTLTPEPQYPTPQFSVSFWFRADTLEWMQTPNARRTLLAHGIWPNTIDVHLIADPNNTAILRLRTVYRVDALSFPVEIIPGEWYMYVLAVDTALGTASAYLNGTAMFEKRPLSFFRPQLHRHGRKSGMGRTRDNHPVHFVDWAGHPHGHGVPPRPQDPEDCTVQ
eukprot:Opistho-2@32050